MIKYGILSSLAKLFYCKSMLNVSLGLRVCGWGWDWNWCCFTEISLDCVLIFKSLMALGGRTENAMCAS